MCEHSPLSADDCKPNKALRLTIKAFLKSEEKKRDKGRSESNPSKNIQEGQSGLIAVTVSKEESTNEGAVASNAVPNAANETNAPGSSTSRVASVQVSNKVRLCIRNTYCLFETMLILLRLMDRRKKRILMQLKINYPACNRL